MVQARNTDRRWSRALQHEHSLRLKLQENIEALANQMTVMEDEIRQKFQGKSLPPSLSGINLEVVDPSQTNSRSGSLKREPRQHNKKQVTVTENAVFEANDYGIKASDEEDQFFDAPEISEEDWAKTGTTGSSTTTSGTSTPVASGSARFELGHKRSVSGVSVNEAQDFLSSPDDRSLPVTSDRKMSVSVFLYFGLKCCCIFSLTLLC